MYTKSRAGQSIKIEKENENVELRKRMKNLPKDKYWINRKESVWDRLSKVHKVPSTEIKLDTIKSHSSLTNISRHSKTFKQMVTNQLEKPQTLRKPLSPNSAASNKRSVVSKKVQMQKYADVTKIDTEPTAFVRNSTKSVHEILSNTKFSSDDTRGRIQSNSFSSTPYMNFHTQCDKIAQISVEEFSEDSNEEYKLAPLMISPSRYSINSCSKKIVKNVDEFLCCKELSIQLEDIELIKDVIKSDKQYQNLDRNPKLLKEILKTQLKNILKHELAVKKALDSLESLSNLQQSHSTNFAKPENEITSYANFNKDTQKLEVDVIFKNVPSLDKEIFILRALGEKLESTLKNTLYHKEKLVASTLGSTTTTKSDILLKNEQKYMPLVYIVKYEKYILCFEHHVEITVQTIGIRLIIGIVKEFYIAEKTILELKKEANRPFYIPISSDLVEMRRTSFEKLTRNPDELLSYIKPKNCEVSFNMLEQDAIFFNNLFNKTFKLSNISLDLPIKDEYYKDNQLEIIQTLCEGGDSQIWKQTTKQKQIKTKKDEFNNNNSMHLSLGSKNDLNSQLISSPSHIQSASCEKQTRRIRRNFTPMPINNYCSPKNILFKTILVGFVQMSVFIIFIMALTYPDVIY